MKTTILASTAAAVFLAMVAAGPPARAADKIKLEQLDGTTPGLKLGSIELGKAYDDLLKEMIPKLAADEVKDRYPIQMDLQKLALYTTRPGGEVERKALSIALGTAAGQAAVKQPARVWLARLLEYTGAEESVPLLNSLLNDKDVELREVARRSLEKNPAPTAVAPLQRALAAAKDPKSRAGLIQSLGERKDAASLPVFEKGLTDPDFSVVAASAGALVKNGTMAGAAGLARVLPTLKGPAQSRVFEALFELVSSVSRSGDAASAAKVLLRLDEWAVTPHQKAAIFNARLAADPKGSVALIKDGLKSPNKEIQSVALKSALASPDKSLLEGLTALIPTLPVAVKAQVLNMLVENKNPDAEKQALGLINEKDATARGAALTALATVGTVASLDALLGVGSTGTPDEKGVALRALEAMKGDDVNAKLLEKATAGDDKVRAAAIGLLSTRKAADLTPKLMEWANDGSPLVASAVAMALGRAGGEEEARAMIKDLKTAADPGKRTSLRDTLLGILPRLEKPEELGVTLSRTAANAPTANRLILIELFGGVGGDAMLEAVRTYLADDNDDVKLAAAKALGNWRDFAAAPDLQKMAADTALDLKYHAIAVTGLSRLVSSSDKTPAAERVKAAADLLKISRRPEEKRAVLSALGSIGDNAAAETILGALSDADVKVEAGLAATTLAEKLLPANAAAATALATKIKAAAVSDAVTKKAEAILAK